MATCIYCHQRKGKRTCPALQGSICSTCCGDHRLALIDCPSGCVYLGGLSLVREGATGFSKAEYETAVQGLIAHCRTEADKSVSALIDGRLESWEQPVFMGWLIYGKRDASGQRLIDRYLAARGRSLAPGIVSAVLALQKARAALFEVEDVQLHSGIDMRDVISGECIHVREVSGTEQLNKWDLMFAWIMKVDDHFELTGATLLVPRKHFDAVREALVGETDIASAGVGVMLALRAAIHTAPRPEIRTTDGEEIVVSKSHYEVRDVDRVRKILRAIPELQAEDSNSFTWLKKSKRGVVVLGGVRLADQSLILETMSNERKNSGRKLLEKRLGSAIVHRADTVQDIAAALRRSQPSHETPGAEQLEMLAQYFQDYYRRWIDEPVPALGNKTPRQAARTKRGRAQVTALLKDIENGTVTQPGGRTVDFAALRREIGIEC